MPLIEQTVNIVSYILFALIVFWFLRYLRHLFAFKYLNTYICELGPNDHDFIKAKKLSSELIGVYGGRRKKKIVDTFYCGIEPILFDTAGFWWTKIRRMKYVNVYFHRHGEPFVRDMNGVFVLPERKQQVLEESGERYTAEEEPTKAGQLKPISDIEFCKADFEFSLRMNAINEFGWKSKNAFRMNDYVRLTMIMSVVTVLYLIVKFRVLDIIYSLMPWIKNILMGV